MMIGQNRASPMIRPRFMRAVNTSRPYGTHRYDVFGPKVGRRLGCSGGSPSICGAASNQTPTFSRIASGPFAFLT
jgi:hypothetical protein